MNESQSVSQSVSQKESGDHQVKAVNEINPKKMAEVDINFGHRNYIHE